MKIESLLVHGAVDGDDKTGSVNVPIYQTATYKQEELGKNKGYEYSRTGNPTREALEKTIALLEDGIGGLAFSSGMAAITATLSLFKSGDRIVIPSNLYGGTFRVVDNVFKNFNIQYEIVDFSRLKDVKRVLESSKQFAKIKAVFIETPTNPLMDITDIEEVSKLAKEYGALTIVDNTFMSPYLQRPLKFGADIVVHSATKYLGGHSNVVAGLIAVKDQELWDKLHFIQNSTGGVLAPFDSFMLLQGIKTLGVRLDRHIENAEKIVEFLSQNEYVKKIYYPGLKDSKGYEIHKKQASGCGGVLSFVIDEKVDYKKFLSSLKLITLGESLGGVESLICHPATMTHAAIPYKIRQEVGIVDNLVRLSVGIENIDDLLQDLNNAFKESVII
ncbi:trans-sulfuration enzyme family protein [Clostridium saccharobutylicum]|uniref:Cystathionine beta-lyase n=1 Tax=Clostridium saccharobutylicum TaxID=169679 RepID=A0A1S8NCY9_CLOSA|nr:PLP-dependent aspartate aminotransferase family protein [Clostridium saccharobutylicum]OOM14364.1 cystathionine beta-lyase [Clostridium saccharobutylicum]